MWESKLQQDPQGPYPGQWSILREVLNRCVQEHLEEEMDKVNTASSPEQMLHLVHGLPGSGKSRVIKLLRSYFEEVWLWTHGVYFVFLAPMNTMASNIEGFTSHSWGEIDFMKDGFTISSKRCAMGCYWSSMRTKCESMRFCLIDEIENVGAGTLGDLDQHVTGGARSELYKYRQSLEAAVALRPFKGMNMIFCGDFGSCHLSETYISWAILSVAKRLVSARWKR